MTNLKYQNWYVGRKADNANLLYEKLKSLSIKKDLINEADDQDTEEVEVDVDQMAAQYAQKMGVGGDKEFIEQAKKTINATLDNYDPQRGGYVMDDNAATPAAIALIKAKAKKIFSENEKKVYNTLKNKVKDKQKLKKIIKEESQKYLLNENILASFLTGALSFLAKIIADYGIKLVTTYAVGKLIYSASEQLGAPAINTASNVLKGLEAKSGQIGTSLGTAGAGLAGTLANVGQAGERASGSLKMGTEILATGTSAAQDRQLKMWCRKTGTVRYVPGEPKNVGDIFLASKAQDPSNIYVYLVTEVDKDTGDFDAKEVLCDKPLKP